MLLPMTASPLFGPSQRLRLLSFITLNLLFATLMLSLLWSRADHEARVLTGVGVNKTLQIVENALRRAELNLTRSQPLLTQSCQQALPALQQLAAKATSLNAIYLADREHGLILCASAWTTPAPAAVPLSALIGRADPARAQLLWRRQLPLTSQHGMVLYRPMANGQALIGVMHANMLEDLLKVMRGEMIDEIGITLSGLRLENRQGTIQWDSQPANAPLEVRQHSDLQPGLQVSARYSPALVWRLARLYLPLALCGIALFMLGSAWILWRRYSPGYFFRRAILTAIRGRQFVPYYQAIRCRKGESAFEVLVRWQHPQKGLLMPGAFIAQVEALGWLSPMMIQVMQQVERDLRQAGFPRGSRLAINLSPQQLLEQEMLAAIRQFQHHLRQAGHSLVIEVTEEGLIQDPQHARQIMASWRAEGIGVAIDDFGIGHSSLAYLRQFPFDYLKIDKSFIDALPQGEKDRTIIEGIMTLARQLELTVVAEGVEQQEQADYLWQIGVDCQQGFLFARPQPIASICGLQAG
ncbi:hypothetical protein THUN1379_02440 [Paludibacterium sp. THUN1379]|nr:hypothetical protein THUN1379_02440 [Paludibacterium sp. THUN1379]